MAPEELPPDPANVERPVDKSPTSAHAEPSQSSVKAVPPTPAKTNAFVLDAPVPLNCRLAVFKFPTSVHDVPFQVSALAVAGGTCPPANIADVEVPPPATSPRAVFKSATSVHEEPSQDSLVAVTPGAVCPPEHKAAVEVLIQLMFV